MDRSTTSTPRRSRLRWTSASGSRRPGEHLVVTTTSSRRRPLSPRARPTLGSLPSAWAVSRWRSPAASAQRTASSPARPSGTCHPPRPTSGIWLPSASTRARPSGVTVAAAIRGSWTPGRDLSFEGSERPRWVTLLAMSAAARSTSTWASVGDHRAAGPGAVPRPPPRPGAGRGVASSRQAGRALAAGRLRARPQPDPALGSVAMEMLAVLAMAPSSCPGRARCPDDLAIEIAGDHWPP
jgi:hypothetical protein